MKNLISFVLRKIPRKYIQVFITLIPKFFAPFYAGNKVSCTVCEKNFRKFMPYGRGPSARENVLCPNCLSLERHRLMWYFMKEKTNFFTAPLKVLHVAPELCFMKRFDEMPNIEYITGDIESPMAKVKMDVHDIPFEEASFDVAICNHVMEHVDDALQALGEFYRILKPGGWGIFQVPIDYSRSETYEDKTITAPLEREKHFGQDDHQRVFGTDYGDYLKKAGFTVTEDHTAQEISEELRNRFRFDLNEIIYFCQK